MSCVIENMQCDVTFQDARDGQDGYDSIVNVNVTAKIASSLSK